MTQTELLKILTVAGKLKTTTRHCDTAPGRKESVADHSWRIALMAMLLEGEFPEADMNKVIAMSIIHDLGEAFTGDIPVFCKTAADEQKEEELLYGWVRSLPGEKAEEMLALYQEMEARQTLEAKIYKTLDGLEAVIQHNFSNISTWLPNEYELNQTYAWDRVDFSGYMKELRQEILNDTLKKIEKEG